ncbi:MAG TPA: Gfo/Idh/MocA family oxidoreductase [Chloroflexota bacterium]
MSATRVGIVGLGQMGRYHAQAYRAAGVSIVGVCDANLDLAEAFGREFAAPWFTSLERLLQAPGLSALSICTPPHLHLPVLRAALEANLDVLCEKPLASTLADGRAMQALIPADRVVMLCFFHRFHEPIVRLRQMLEAGDLGTPIVLRNRFALDMRADARPWIWDPARAGGGAVLNTSVHSVDLFRFLMGEPERVAARMQPLPSEATLERNALLVLEGERGGAVGILEASSFAVEKEYSLSVESDVAVAEVGWNPPSLRIRRLGATGWQQVPIVARGALNRIQTGVEHFLECVTERGRPRAEVADGVRALEIAAAAYRSVAEDRFIACGPSSLGGTAAPIRAG